MFVALVTQHVKRMRRIVIRDLYGSTIFFLILSHKPSDLKKLLTL